MEINDNVCPSNEVIYNLLSRHAYENQRPLTCGLFAPLLACMASFLTGIMNLPQPYINDHQRCGGNDFIQNRNVSICIICCGRNIQTAVIIMVLSFSSRPCIPPGVRTKGGFRHQWFGHIAEEGRRKEKEEEKKNHSKCFWGNFFGGLYLIFKRISKKDVNGGSLNRGKLFNYEY